MAKLEEISREIVERAIALYLAAAYSESPPAGGIGYLEAQGIGPDESFLQAFSDETRSDRKDRSVPKLETCQVLHRYSLRLGNRNYPFMKLVLQEHLMPGEYYFAIDTHDLMEILQDFPDYEDWMRLKRFNRSLKAEIEERFKAADVPTLSSLCCFGEELDAKTASRRQRDLILLVDDEEAEATLLCRLLRRQGFSVERASNGKEALERLAVIHPALIILDCEMPVMDGLTLFKKLRAQEGTRFLPILLTTASEVLSSKILAWETREGAECSDGFLAKPFHCEDLFELMDRLLKAR